MRRVAHTTSPVPWSTARSAAGPRSRRWGSRPPPRAQSRRPRKRAPGSIDVPVPCGGVVEPDDVVAADDGVSVVPADDAEGVLERSRERLGAETHPCERVEDGAYLYDVGG